MKREDREIYLGTLALIGLVALWMVSLWHAPTDAMQGEVYKILFVHVPVAASAMVVCAGGLFIFSLISLKKVEDTYLRAGKAWAEVGLLLTVLTLATGSIWGRPTWGTWWTWDARITTTFLLAVLMAAYLMLYESMSAGRQRIRVCAVLGIIIFVDVPIIYKSVSWWRTLHQPASLIESRGRTMDSDMLFFLLMNLVVMTIVSIFLWSVRRRNLDMRAQLEEGMLKEVRS